jgi:hypothetical protein
MCNESKGTDIIVCCYTYDSVPWKWAKLMNSVTQLEIAALWHVTSCSVPNTTSTQKYRITIKEKDTFTIYVVA